jgi:hypothetical protein
MEAPRWLSASKTELLPSFKASVDCTVRFYISLKIFGPNRDEVTGKWRKLHNKELYDLYSSPILFR